MSGIEICLCTCGKDLSSSTCAYNFLTNRKKKSQINISNTLSVSMLDTTANLLRYGDILNALNLFNICCRNHMLSTASMRDLYYGFNA